MAAAASASAAKQRQQRRFSSAAVLTSQAVSGRKGTGKVVFGSPAVAEFDLKMPPTSMRKLPPQDAKRMFSMAPKDPPGQGSDSDGSDMDEMTKVNASVLAEVESMLDSDSEDDLRMSTSSRRRSRGRNSASSRRRSSAASGHNSRRASLAIDGDEHTMLLNDSMNLDSSSDSSADDRGEEEEEEEEQHDGEVSFRQNSSYLGSDEDNDDGDANDSAADMSMTANLPRHVLVSGGKKRASDGESPMEEDAKRRRMSRGSGADGQMLANAAAGYDAENDPDEHTVDLGSLGDLLGAENGEGDDSMDLQVQARRQQTPLTQSGAAVSAAAAGPASPHVEETVELEGGIGFLLETVQEGDTSMSGASSTSGSGRGSSGGDGNARFVGFDRESVGSSNFDDDGEADGEVDDGRGSGGDTNNTQTMELEGGIGSLLENLGEDSSAAAHEDDSSVARQSGSSRDLSAVQSPSTDSMLDESAGGGVDGTNTSEPVRRNTPAPAVFSISTITDRLELGDVFSAEVLGGNADEQAPDLSEEALLSLLSKPDADAGDSACADGSSGVENPLITARKEAMRKTVMLLRERTADLRRTLSSGKFRLALQKLGQKFNSADEEDQDGGSDVVAEMRRNAAVFVEVSKLEAQADYCMQACELERLTLEQLKHSLARVRQVFALLFCFLWSLCAASPNFNFVPHQSDLSMHRPTRLNNYSARL